MDLLAAGASLPTQQQVRLHRNLTVKASLEGDDIEFEKLGTQYATTEACVAVIDSSVPGWIRVVVDLPHVRVAVWLPRTGLEFLTGRHGSPPGFCGEVLDLSVRSTHARYFTIPRGTPLFVRPQGEIFAVTTDDVERAMVRETEGFVEVSFDSPWGMMTAWVACPCDAMPGYAPLRTQAEREPDVGRTERASRSAMISRGARSPAGRTAAVVRR